MKEGKNILEFIEAANRIVITSHRSPDGDSVGSSLGMMRFLKAIGKDAVICHPDPAPAFLNWIKGNDCIWDFETDRERVEEEITKADLIFCLDYNGFDRMGNEMGALVRGASAKKVMIDHHPFPDDGFAISASYPKACSTSELILDFMESIGKSGVLNSAIGSPLYLGIVTDTGSFRFPSVTGQTHRRMGTLLDAGVRHWEIHEQTFDNNRLDKLRLRGYAMAEKVELLPEYQTAILSLTSEELKRFNYAKGDTEGLVNSVLSVEGVTMAVSLLETDGKVKISFRSQGDSAVNEIAADHFGGGGHKNAAGGVSTEGMEATIEKIKRILPEYRK